MKPFGEGVFGVLSHLMPFYIYPYSLAKMCQALEVSNSEFVKQLFSLRRWLSFQPERRCLVVAVPVVDLNSRRANDHQQKFQRIVNSVYAHFESNERASVAKLDWVRMIYDDTPHADQK